MALNNPLQAFDGIVKPLDIALSQPQGHKLQGLSFAVKDICAIAGETTGFGNIDWQATHEVEKTNAPVIDLLLEQGARLVAKACSDELALSLDGINVHFGTPVNPQWPERIPGGSSSGPASMVAAGLVDFGIGTDTAGSIRVPASYCGIYSLRPTFDAINSDSFLPLGPSFDTVGILASDIEILTKVASCLLYDRNEQERSTIAARKKLIILDECFQMLSANLAPDMMAALQRLKSCFEKVTTVQTLLPQHDAKMPKTLEEIVENFAAIRGYEAWQCHGQWIESVNPDMAESIKSRFLLCRNATAGDANKARMVQKHLQQFLAEILGDHTFFCLPTTVGLPPLKISPADQLQENRLANMQLCSIASFAGLPQVTIPVFLNQYERQYGQQNGLTKSSRPLASGISLIGGKNQDLLLLAAAADAVRALNH